MATRRRHVRPPEAGAGIEDPELRAVLRAEARALEEMGAREAEQRAAARRGLLAAGVAVAAAERLSAGRVVAVPVAMPGGGVWERLLGLEAGWVRSGLPALSGWWRGVLEEWLTGERRALVGRVGRRGGKSSSLCRWAVAEVVGGEHEVPEADLGVGEWARLWALSPLPS